MPTIYLHFIPHLILSNSGKWWLVGIESHHKSAATKVAAPPPENQELHLLPADFSTKFTNIISTTSESNLLFWFWGHRFWRHLEAFPVWGELLKIFPLQSQESLLDHRKKKQILWEILKIGSLEEVWEQTQNYTLELFFSYNTIPRHIFVKGSVRREIMVYFLWSFLKQIECEAKMHPTTNWNVTVCSHSFVGNLIENYFYS